MIIEMSSRKYTLKQRAQRQQLTRERIVDAAMALHEEIGPAATTVSALAERAGVQRLTVYRHFADEREILQACSAKWLGLHPPPDVADVPEGSPEARIRAALRELYAYYEQTHDMWASLYRDLELTPALREPMAEFDEYLSALCRELLQGWAARRSRRLRATLAHAVQFSTWRSLARQGLKPGAAADLVCRWTLAAAG